MHNHVFDRAKWSRMSIFEQMGNIGSEVGRTFSAKRRGDNDASVGAYCRGLDLLDATAEQLAAQRSPRLREVLRAREQFVQSYETDDSSIEQYFMQFAIAARSAR